MKLRLCVNNDMNWFHFVYSNRVHCYSASKPKLGSFFQQLEKIKNRYKSHHCLPLDPPALSIPTLLGIKNIVPEDKRESAIKLVKLGLIWNKKKHQNKKIQKIFIEWTFFIARASIKNSLIFLCLYSQGSSERNSENQLNFFKIWTCLWQRGILHFTTFHPRMDSKILPSTQIWKWYSSSWVSLPF